MFRNEEKMLIKVIIITANSIICRYVLMPVVPLISLRQMFILLLSHEYSKLFVKNHTLSGKYLIIMTDVLLITSKK